MEHIRPEIFDFEPDLGLELGQTKPKISGTETTNRHTSIPNDYGPISVCLDDDPKLFNCEKAQPSEVQCKSRWGRSDQAQSKTQSQCDPNEALPPPSPPDDRRADIASRKPGHWSVWAQPARTLLGDL